jgi:putative membrane protein
MDPIAVQTLISNIVAAIVFSAIGILLFVLGFLIIDKLTPGSLWHELLEEHNTALAVLMAGIAIALAIIIAAAVV